MAIDNLLTAPRSGPLVEPSILSADFAHLAESCRRALAAGGDLLHLDVMDGHFVPNLTIGPGLCASLRRALPEAFLDVHLMVTDPAGFVDAFADAGADHFTFHVEANDDVRDVARAVRGRGMSAGLALNPGTPVDAILPFLDDVDMVLVMSVNPGFAGQSFIAEVLEKTRAVAARLEPRQRLQMDGGVGTATAAACRDAGCDVLVAGSAIFGSPDYAETIRVLRGTGRGSSAASPSGARS